MGFTVLRFKKGSYDAPPCIIIVIIKYRDIQDYVASKVRMIET